MTRPVLAALALFAGAAFIVPSSATAVPIHQHITINTPVGPDITVTRVVNVAPKDSDDDGCADSDDDYNGPGCHPPPPPPLPAALPTTAPASSTESTATGGYTIPDYIVQCESGGDYNAQNASGAYGAYQIMPDTASNYGCDLSSPAGQDACAADIYADVGTSAWDCG
jgi:hypothetical protein